ncbi:hypothetical protein J2Z37_002097 [Ammoniphilus resinae]|uniref:Uncharacterized protein n=1 Tax=Ammoniphilus resinae TaxID=861532 RepID=A0ABS4GPB0_9BACL|nr:hypothetical protein [Ammoniphilus resinae]
MVKFFKAFVEFLEDAQRLHDEQSKRYRMYMYE